MDKNLFLAVTLSILVYAGWFGFVEKRLEPPRPSAAAQAPAAAPMPAAAPTPSPQSASAPLPPPSAPSTDIPLSRDAITLARLGKTAVQIRSHGAAISSWVLKERQDTIQLVDNPRPGLLATFPNLSFKRLSGPALAFEAREGGLRIVKEFLPGGGTAEKPALPRLRLTIENRTGRPLRTGEWTLSLGPGLGTIESERKDNEKITRTLALLKGDNGLNGKIEVFKKPGDHSTDYRWLGVDNRYFLSAVLPKPGDFEKSSSLPGHGLSLTAPSVELAARSSRVWEVPFYIGAKGNTWLSRYNSGLERSIDFGFFAQLGRAVLFVLAKTQRATGNWGWSIILLTVAIQLIMFPLTYQSLKATSAMKRLQPQIARLQQRYAKEPQRLNSEMMELYKKNGANPLGGCLPMLVQMPVFFALYDALRNAWELHGQAWIWWIHDLSAKDPYYVLPLLMGALMFAQNKLNPAMGTDPTQKQIMLFMPIIFTVMFLRFPSGLVLYWMTNSLISTLAQLALYDRFAKQAPAAS